MSESECKQCGLALPQQAHFCRQCGTPVGTSCDDMGQVLGGAAWIIGVLLWIISGVVAAVAAAEQWDGVKAGAESFFGLLFLLGIIGAGMINSSGKEGKTQ